MKRILLINPYIHDFSAYDFWLKPLGLLYISSFLKEAGYEVELIDLLDRRNKFHPHASEGEYGKGKFYYEIIKKPAVYKNIPRKFKRYGIPLDNFIKMLKNIKKPDLVVVTSMMTYWYPGVKETIEIIKKILGDVKIVVGGVYVNLLPEHAKKHMPAEVLVGDEKVLFQYLEENGGKLVARRNFPDFPMPDYSGYNNLSYISLITSRGCIFRCTYCITHKMWKYEYKDGNKALKEIEILSSKYGVNNIALFDDAFLYHPDITSILKGLSKLNLNIHTPNGLHINRIDPQMAELLYKAGIKTIYLSIESVKESFFQKTGVKVNVNRIKEIVSNLYKTGFKYGNLHAYILAGLPWQDTKEVKETIDFAIDIGLIPHIAEFTPVPGTEESIKGNFENTDPLLLNNSIFPGWGYQKGIEIKKYAKRKLENRKQSKSSS